MGDLESRPLQRRALRVPVRGVAILHAHARATHGTIENLSASGALVDVRDVPARDSFDVELRLGHHSGWVKARTVRVERTGRGRRIAVVFDHVDERARQGIESAIAYARSAARRRPVLVIDDDRRRRIELIRLLAAHGMTPLAPNTMLEAIDLLTRAHLHVDVCLLGESDGHTPAELDALVADSFPWVATAPISDDLEATLDEALDAWAGTDVARIGSAVS